MSKARYLVPIVALLAIASFALAACGSSESDEDKIVSTIEDSATSTDGSSCTEDETAKFVEQNTGESGAAAIKKCEKEATEGNNAESVEVTDVEIEGSSATANVAITGSPLDGQTLEVGLVEEEGDWKLNEFAGFAKLNQQKLVEAFGESLEESGEVEPELASCIIEGLGEASEEEVEELFIDHSEEVIEGVAEGCQE